MKHTPGPWKVFNNREIGPISKEDDQSYGVMLPVAYIEQYDYPNDYEANARLIAAAPELLEALITLELYARDLLLLIDGGSEVVKYRNTVRLGLELAVNDLDLCKTDKDYKRIEDRLISLYLDIARLRNMRKELGLK